MTETEKREKILQQFITEILGNDNWNRILYLFTSKPKENNCDRG